MPVYPLMLGKLLADAYLTEMIGNAVNVDHGST